jgi:hypothetical protein
MSSIDFDTVVKRLQMDALRIQREYKGVSGHEENSPFIDIDEFIEVLYSLLKSNNYLYNEEFEDDATRFLLTEEYPDVNTENRNIITFDIKKRSPASLSANKDPFTGTKTYRPMYIGEEKDSKDGGRIIKMQMIYDNRLRFVCWSNKVGKARRLATLFESILLKYYWTLRQHVSVLIYEGREDGRISNEYGDNRYQGIPLTVFVRTHEMIYLKEQELKGIDLDVDVCTSL